MSISELGYSQDLDELVAVWPELPEHIKAAKKALIQANSKAKVLATGRYRTRTYDLLRVEQAL